MLDINLGNKTLFVGVLIALILSYGMINFDSTPTTGRTVSAIATSIRADSTDESAVAKASSENSENFTASDPTGAQDESVSEATRLRRERREQRHM